MTPLEIANDKIADLQRRLAEMQEELDEQQGRAVRAEGLALMDHVGAELGLTRSEAAVLICIANGKGQPVSHSRLLFSLPSGRARAEDYSYITIPVLVSRIRDQVGRKGIVAVRDRGYFATDEVIACVEMLRHEFERPKPPRRELWKKLQALFN